MRSSYKKYIEDDYDKDIKSYDKLCNERRGYWMGVEGELQYHVYCLGCLTYHRADEFKVRRGTTTGRELYCKMYYIHKPKVEKPVEIVNPRACKKAREILKRVEHAERMKKINRINQRAKIYKKDVEINIPINGIDDIIPDSRDGITFHK